MPSPVGLETWPQRVGVDFDERRGGISQDQPTKSVAATPSDTPLKNP